MGLVWSFSMCMSSSLGIHTVSFCVCVPNTVQITIRDRVMTSYPVSNQDGGHGVAIVLPVPILRTCHHQHVILHLPTKFCPNGTIRDRVMTSYPFSRCRPLAILNFFQGYCRPPTKCKWGVRSILKFRLDRIKSRRKSTENLRFGENGVKM